MNTIFIGIAGGTGSGKTTLTEHLKQHFGDDISVVHHDSYYKYQDRPFEAVSYTHLTLPTKRIV